MNNWIILTILYSIFTAFFESSKKKAVEKNSIYEVLAFFSLISFFLVAILTKDAFSIDYKYLPIIIFKATIIVVAWILGLKAIEKMEIGLYSIIKICRVIFSVILSCLFLGESLTISMILGMIIVITGVVLVNKTTKGEKKKTTFTVIILLLISCFLNSISEIIDKKILMYITSSQLQFWFMLFLTIYYWIILISKKEKTNWSKLKTNYWIPVAALCLVIGDKALFLANSNIDSKVVVMTMIKQLSLIITIILGKILFKEKDIVKKLLYSILIIIGIGIMFIA